MTESVENLILEHLRAIRTSVSRMETDVGDLKTRMTSVEEHLGALGRDLGMLHGDIAGSTTSSSG